jgi:hypothetical protein
MVTFSDDKVFKKVLLTMFNNSGVLFIQNINGKFCQQKVEKSYND